MTSNKQSQKERLKDIFLSTIDSGLTYKIENLDEIDYYKLLCQSIANNKIVKMFNCNLSMFNCKYSDEDSVLIIFSIPLSIKEENSDGKHISERIMDIIKTVEDCFVTVDYMKLKEVKEDKFSYITIIKKIKH